MQDNKCFENYPLSFVFIANLFQTLIYLNGASIIIYLGIIWLVIYLLFVIFLEFKLLKNSCINCYYYGKICFSGKGKLSSLFFKKGSTGKFNSKQMKFVDVLPDFLVSVIPMITGIVLLIIHFEWLLLILVIILFLLTFIGNGLIRGSLACKFCKQKNTGCPAEQFFNKTKK